MYDIVVLKTRLASAFPLDSIVADHTDNEHYYRNTQTGTRAASVTTKLGIINKGYLQAWYAKLTVEYIRERLSLLCAGDLSVLESARGAASRSRDTSAEIGTSAHDAYDRYLTEWITIGSRPDTPSRNFLSPEAGGDEICATRSFDRFLNEVEIIPVASEIKVWYEHGNDCFAGTVDALFIVLTVRKDRSGDPRCQHDYQYQEGSKVFWCPVCDRECNAKLVLGDHKTSNSIKGKDDYAQQGNAYAKAIEKATGIKIDEVWVMRYGKTKAEYEVMKVKNRKQAWAEFLGISRAYDIIAARGEQSLLVPLKEKVTQSLYDTDSD